MDNAEDHPFPEDDFEVEDGTFEADDTLPVESSPGHVLFRTPLARRLAVALGVLLVIALIVVSVPSLPGQALGLLAEPATPTSGGASSVSIILQPTSGSGWTSSGSLTLEPGWTQTGPLYASVIAFAPSVPPTAYACGPNSIVGSQKAPLTVGVSLDSARTWRALSTPATGIMCNLTIDPTNAQDVVMIASLGNQCTSPTASKLYRTFDGGAHWSLWSLPSLGQQSSGLLCYQWGWAGSTLYIAPLLSGDTAYKRLAASVNGQAFVWLNPQDFLTQAPSNASISRLFTADNALYIELTSQGCQSICYWFSKVQGGVWSRFAPSFREQPVLLLGIGAVGRTLLGQVFQRNAPDNRIYVRSSDGGTTWSALPPQPKALIAGQVQAAPDGTVYADFDQNLSNAPDAAPLGIYMIAPGAATWSYVVTAPTGSPFIVAWNAAGHPVALWGSLYAVPMWSLETHQL